MADWKTKIECFEEDCSYQTENSQCSKDEITLGKIPGMLLGKLACRQAKERPEPEPEEPTLDSIKEPEEV